MTKLLTEGEMSALLNASLQSDRFVSDSFQSQFMLHLLQQDVAWWECMSHEYLNKLTQSLRQHNFVNLNLEYLGLTVLRYRSWLSTFDTPCVMQSTEIGQGKGKIIFGLNSEWIFKCIENYFGGNVISKNNFRRTEFTLVELRLIRELVPLIIDSINDLALREKTLSPQQLTFDYSAESFEDEIVDENVYCLAFTLKNHSKAKMEFVFSQAAYQTFRDELMAEVRGE